MDYFIYLKVPEYTRQYALFHFRDPKIEDAINVKNWYVLYGMVVDSLKRRNNYNPNQESGNLKLVLPDSRMKRKSQWNYMDANSRSKIAEMIRYIMYSQFWRFIMPVWEVIKQDRNKRKKGHTFDRYVLQFFDMNGIEYTEQASNSFKKEFARQRKILERNFNITI